MNSKRGITFSIVAIAATIALFASGPLVVSHQAQAYPYHHFGYGYHHGFHHFGYGYHHGFRHFGYGYHHGFRHFGYHHGFY